MDRTITRSFRIDEKAFKIVQDEAKRLNLSVNTLVNQQILSFVNFDRFFEKIGMMKIAGATFAHLLRSSSELEVIEAGTLAGSDIPRTIILAKDGKLSLDSVIRYLRMMSDYAHFYEYNEVEVERKRTITLMHALGPKGSLFLIHYMGAVLSTIDIKPVFSSTDHSVTAEF